MNLKALKSGFVIELWAVVAAACIISVVTTGALWPIAALVVATLVAGKVLL